MSLTKRVNRRAEIEKLLHQDHSDIYFNNQRLDNALNSKIEFMRKEKHRHEIKIKIEISELRREITRISLQQTSNNNERLEDIARRPYTAPDPPTRIKPEVTGSRKQVQSAWNRTINNKVVSQNLSTQATSIERPDTPICTVSTLRNAQTHERYKQISAKCFKENNRFPLDWYVKYLPSSDAIIHSIRRTMRSKSAVAKFDFLSQLQEKEEMEMKFEQFSKVKETKYDDNKTNEDTKQASDGNMNLVCETHVKPVLISRKQLVEIANVESCVDKGSSRNAVRKQGIKDLNALDSRRIQMRVKTFCKTIEDFKEREMKFLKEREEARRREAQEKLYLMAIDMTKLEQQLPEYDIKRYVKLQIMST